MVGKEINGRLCNRDLVCAIEFLFRNFDLKIPYVKVSFTPYCAVDSKNLPVIFKLECGK